MNERIRAKEVRLIGEDGTNHGVVPTSEALQMAEDADLDLAAKNIVAGAYSYSRQRCTAIKRVLVVNEVADKLV